MGFFFRIFDLIPTSNFSCEYRDNHLILSGDIKFYFQPKDFLFTAERISNYFVLENIFLSIKNTQLCFKNIHYANHFLVNKGNYFSESDVIKIVPYIVTDI